MPVIPGNNFNQRGVVHFPTDICRTIIGGGGSGGYHAGNEPKIITKGSKLMEGTVEKDWKVYAIRKLTPLECWRLMGFSDEDFHKAEAVNSNTQLYKQAGNSIVKDVLMAIFSQMIEQPKGR